MELVRNKKLLKQIFADHWAEFVKEHPDLRPSIQTSVEKILSCGTEDAGFHLYRCPSCGEEKRVPHSCKSRFCPSCGVAQTDQWIEKYTTLFANTQYQHIVFHPPSQFRPYFAEGYLPGIMNVAHTFGRDIKFTPHIHMLITCGGLNQACTRWIPCHYIPHQFLKSHFRFHFIKTIKQAWVKQQLKTIPTRLRCLFTAAYQQRMLTYVLTVIWYVHIGVKLANASFTIRYIGQYTKRPAIAESRVKTYDGRLVTFTYQDHMTDRSATRTLPVFDFIGLLIRHIPDVNFRIIHYLGFYANRVRGKLLPKVFTILNQAWEKIKERLTSIGSWWRRQLDPLICPVSLIPLS